MEIIGGAPCIGEQDAVAEKILSDSEDSDHMIVLTGIMELFISLLTCKGSLLSGPRFDEGGGEFTGKSGRHTMYSQR